MKQAQFSDFDGSFPGLPARMTQTEFAKLIGIDQSLISRALDRKILSRGADWRIWVQELYKHSAEVAGGRRGEGTLDLVQERAWLAKVQAEKTEFELRRARQEFLPLNFVCRFIQTAYASVRSHLLGLPTRMKSVAPELSIAGFKKMTDLIHEFLNELAVERLPPEIHDRYKNWLEHGDENFQAKKKMRNGEIDDKLTEAVPGR